MSKLFLGLNRFVFYCFVLGVVIIAFFFGSFVTSFSPAVSFEELLDGEEIKKGSHVKGNLVFALPPFASESTYTEHKDGSRSASKVTGNFYMIPTSEGFVGLKANTDMEKDMDKLVDETYDYLDGGDIPEMQVYIEGEVLSMKKDMVGFYQEYMQESGYTEEEINDMGDPLVVHSISVMNVRIATAVGCALILLAIGLAYRNYKKNQLEEQQGLVTEG